MTIIVPIKKQLVTGKFIYGLSSDLIYAPWTNPSIMESSKLLSQDDFVWGVTGDISVINIEAIDATTFDEFRSKLKTGTANTTIVVMYNEEVYTYDCNENKKTWSNASRTGEPLSWGCFLVPFNRVFNAYIVNDDRLVFRWISILHNLYGSFKRTEDCVSADYSKCIRFSKADAVSMRYQHNRHEDDHNVQ